MSNSKQDEGFRKDLLTNGASREKMEMSLRKNDEKMKGMVAKHLGLGQTTCKNSPGCLQANGRRRERR